jgi:hypothetical protein
LPAATIRGSVYNQEGLIVPNSRLNVKCGSISYDARTDRFGSFELDVAAGNCDIYAMDGSFQGFKSIVLEQGDLLLNEQLILDQRVIGGSVIVSIIAGVIINR